jgi:hypothetical protein
MIGVATWPPMPLVIPVIAGSPVVDGAVLELRLRLHVP